MALKSKITKAEFDKLHKSIQAEYFADGDDYSLDVEGAEDTGALKRAKDRETQKRKEAEEAAREAQEKLDAIDNDDARKKGDIETLEKKWTSDLQAEKDAHAATETKYQTAFKTQMIDNAAAAMAAKISKVPGLMSRAIKERLTVDFEGEMPATKVLDADGKPSDMSIDDLQKEFVANKDYADIIIASKASGGAGKKTPGGGAPTNPENHGQQTDQKPDLSKMDATALAAHIKDKKAAEAEE